MGQDEEEARREWERERKRAYRERKRAEINAEQEKLNVQAPRQRGLDSDGRPATLRGLMSAAREGTIVLTDREEEQIRNHFGYATSEKRTYLEREQAARRVVEVTVDASGTVTRYTLDGTPVEEPVGPAGLSLVAFPVQEEGDLTPTPEQRAKLG